MDTEKQETHQHDTESAAGMKTFIVKFKIKAPQYAARFGIDIPDDSPDEIIDDTISDGSDYQVVSAEAEDATVTYGANMSQHSSLYGQCAATLAQCKAKNPMTCRYHGAMAIANDIEDSLKTSGISGSVACELLGIDNNTLSIMATITAPAADEQKIRDALTGFFKLPGVDGDAENIFEGSNPDEYEGAFDIDMLDAKAKARWGANQSPPAQATTVPPPAPQPSPQPTAAVPQPQPATPTPQPKRTRTRKRTNVAPQTASEVPPLSAPEPVQAESNSEQSAIPDDDNSPVLFPSEKPPKPPSYQPPFSQTELDSLNQMTVRLVKTARQINNHIEKGTTDTWIGNSAPNLPDSLDKYVNEVNGATLKELADKDTDGQVKELYDLFDAIEKSRANGWKDKVAESKWDAKAPAWWQPSKPGNVDIRFDASKYDDPYQKEREAYANYQSGADIRSDAISALSMVERSKDADAPKDALNDCKRIDKEMSDLEDDYNVAKAEGAPDWLLKKFGQANYALNEKFQASVNACNDWINKQSIMQATVEDTARVFKEKNGYEALYLTKLADHLKEQEKVARDVLSSEFPCFKKDPEGCTKMFEKNVKYMLDHGSIRIAMDLDAVLCLLREPKGSKTRKSNGWTDGEYQSKKVDYDYVCLAEKHFKVSPKNTQDVHKYAALFKDNGEHSNDRRSMRYGEIEVAINPRKCLAFLGGCHSQTRYASARGWNASLITDPKITIVPYLLNNKGYKDRIEKLFTTDYTTKPNGFEKVWSALSVRGNSSYNDAVPEIWLGDKVTRDMVSGIYTQSSYLRKQIEQNAGQYIKEHKIDIK